jgi:hypothetical protein
MEQARRKTADVGEAAEREAPWLVFLEVLVCVRDVVMRLRIPLENLVTRAAVPRAEFQ